jgi:hypothetical protein
MEWHFGHNCRHYLPTLSKCRILIDKYRARKDLLAKKEFSTQDLLVYLNLSADELLRKIAPGHINATRLKNGKWTFTVSVPWQYDDCGLASTGGRCLYFEAHSGKPISCIAELETAPREHPNCRNVPSEEDVKACERELLKATLGPRRHQ